MTDYLAHYGVSINNGAPGVGTGNWRRAGSAVKSAASKTAKAVSSAAKTTSGAISKAKASRDERKRKKIEAKIAKMQLEQKYQKAKNDLKQSKKNDAKEFIKQQAMEAGQTAFKTIAQGAAKEIGHYALNKGLEAMGVKKTDDLAKIYDAAKKQADFMQNKNRSEQQLMQTVRSMRNRGMSDTAIAKDLQVSESTVSGIKEKGNPQQQNQSKQQKQEKQQDQSKKSEQKDTDSKHMGKKKFFAKRSTYTPKH